MKQLLYFSALIIVFASCTKKIDVDLNDANPNVVIEANYSANDSTVRVRITTTSSYFDQSGSPEINNATVTITDHLGNSTPVNFVGNGNYELTAYIPNYNTNYTLSVVANGELFEATCAMKSPVDLLPITFEYFPPLFGGEDGYVPFMNFVDPVDTVNHYIIALSKNDQVWDLLPDLFSQDDKLTDGNLIERPLFPNEFYQLGDTIKMELRMVDKSYHDYIIEAQSIAGSQSTAAPANPTNNWSNSALGYFNCYSSSFETVVVE